MLVEGPQRDWLAFGHVVVQPTAVDLSEGNASGTIDRIGQPDSGERHWMTSKSIFGKDTKNSAYKRQSFEWSSSIFGFFQFENTFRKTKGDD